MGPGGGQEAFVLAAHYAHKNERAAAFTLSDPLDRYRVEFLDLMQPKTIDYVFANVNELKSLYQTDDLGESGTRDRQGYRPGGRHHGCRWRHSGL